MSIRFQRAARLFGIPCILLVGVRCAHVEPPSGGPVDTVRPAVAAVYPAPGATRVPAEARVIFQFSEWIDRGSNRGTVVVSPPYPGRVRVEVDGDKLIARPPAGMEWRADETHVVTVLGTLKDLRGNALGQGFDLRFSTGLALDSAEVSGALGIDARRGPLVAALYRMSGRDTPGAIQALSPRDTRFSAAPTPEPWRELPAYLAGADSTGKFNLNGAKAGEYSLFAFEDVNGNFAFDAGLEAAAAGSTALILRPRASEQSLRLVPMDTIPLRMIEINFVAEPVDSSETSESNGATPDTAGGLTPGIVLVKFSREPHPARALESNRYFVVSDSGAPLAVTDVAWSPENSAWALQVPPLRANERYRVAVRGRPDFVGRFGADEPDTSVTFTVGSSAKTSKTSDWQVKPLLSVGGPDGKPRVSADLTTDARQTFFSSLPLTPQRWNILERRLEGRVRFTESDTTPVIVPLRLQRTNLMSFSAELSRPLRAGSALELKLRPETGGDTMSALVLLTGRVPDSSQTARVKLVPRSDRADWLFWAQSKANPNLQVPLRRGANGDTLASSPVPAGLYRVIAYRDTDGDGVWNPGSIRPWITQEPFEVFADSLAAE